MSIGCEYKAVLIRRQKFARSAIVRAQKKSANFIQLLVICCFLTMKSFAWWSAVDYANGFGFNAFHWYIPEDDFEEGSLCVQSMSDRNGFPLNLWRHEIKQKLDLTWQTTVNNYAYGTFAVVADIINSDFHIAVYTEVMNENDTFEGGWVSGQWY